MYRNRQFRAKMLDFDAQTGRQYVRFPHATGKVSGDGLQSSATNRSSIAGAGFAGCPSGGKHPDVLRQGRRRRTDLLLPQPRFGGHRQKLLCRGAQSLLWQAESRGGQCDQGSDFVLPLQSPAFAGGSVGRTGPNRITLQTDAGRRRGDRPGRVVARDGFHFAGVDQGRSSARPISAGAVLPLARLSVFPARDWAGVGVFNSHRHALTGIFLAIGYEKLAMRVVTR